MPRSAAFSVLLLVSVAAVRPATSDLVPTTLLLRVVDSVSNLALPNAEVTAVSRRALTNEKGEVRIVWPADGAMKVRVRQLGFRYVERTLTRGTSTSATVDTVTIALAHAEFALPQVLVRAESRCKAPSNPAQAALSQTSMDLLRFGAEQYGTFERTYPSVLTLERRSSTPTGQGGALRTEREQEITSSADWGDRYTPGQVLQHTGAASWFVPLLFVSALADSAFHARHCFVARGVESREGRRVIRLDFNPARGITETEWEGAAWIDSAASVLRRVEFRLTNLRGYGPRYFEGYTVFSTPSPFIARPDSTMARWSTQGSAAYGAPVSPEATQALVIREVRYTSEKPPVREREQ